MAERAPAAYWHLLLAQIRAQASYRVSFLLDLAGSTVLTALDLLTVLVLFRVTRSLGGFAVRQVFLIACLANFSFALADLAVGNIERLRVYVRNGLLDAVLVRPRGALLQLLATDFAPRRAGRVVQGLAAYVVALAWAHPRLDMARWMLVGVAPVAGALFFVGIFVAGATVAFYWIESGEFANGFTYGGRDFTTYPVTVYGGTFRALFAYGLGFAFVAYYPALFVLGQADPLGGPAWLGWTSPLVAAIALAAGVLTWRVGVRHYRSTGS